MKKANRSVSIFFIVLASYLFYTTLKWHNDVALFPRILLIIIGGLNVILLITGGGTNVDKDKKGIFDGVVVSRLFVSIAACIIYIVCIGILGFYTSTFLFIAGMFVYVGFRKNFMFIIAPAAIMAGFYGIFSFWLKVPVPHGILF